jgi:hypothetical protein
MSADTVLYREKEVARLLKVSVFKLQRDRCRGTGIPFIKFGRMIRYRKSAVDGFIDQHDPAKSQH